MSSGGDKRRSLGKYVKRMGSVFKREKSTQTPTSTPSNSGPSASPAVPTAAVTSSSTPAEPRRAITPAEPSEPQVPVPALSTSATEPVPQTVNRSALQQERTRALFAKYGLTLESHDWIASPPMPTNVQRIEKPIRMRVHRSCHRCGATFGAEKVCSGCDHRRCKRCPRFPKKRTAAEKAAEKTAETENSAKPPKKKHVLAVTSKDGNERVYQRKSQRVRRTCHKCETLFVPPTATVCEGCQHVRCTKCPRDPAKLDKWPNGYPGDAEPDSETDVERELARVRRTYKKPRQRVRWECEECNSIFVEGSANCPGCGHERCERCKRTPLKRVTKEKEFDPELVRAVEAKLKALSVEEGATGTTSDTTYR